MHDDAAPATPNAGNANNIFLFEFLAKLANNTKAADMVNQDSMNVKKNNIAKILVIGITAKIDEFLSYFITIITLIKIISQIGFHMKATYHYDPSNNVLIPSPLAAFV